MNRNDKYRIKHKYRDDIYRKYKKSVNMTFRQLLTWSKSDCSKKASINRNPIKRNLQLLKTPRTKWTMKHIRWANKTISFISRMKKVKAGKPVSKKCPFSRKTISLMNWAYNPNK